jgi:hypothetical protein
MGLSPRARARSSFWLDSIAFAKGRERNIHEKDKKIVGIAAKRAIYPRKSDVFGA